MPRVFPYWLSKVAVFATCISIVGYLVATYDKAQDDAARRLALRNAPPETVSVVDFDPLHHTGFTLEVAVLAKLDPAYALRRTLLLDGMLRRTLIVPLLRPDAVPEDARADTIFGAIAIPLERGESDGQALRRRLPGAQQAGASGRAIEIKGQRILNIPFTRRVSENLTGSGRETVRPLVTIVPFDGPRDQALARESDFTYGHVLLVLSVLLALLSAMLLHARTDASKMNAVYIGTPHRQAHPTRPRAAKALARFVPLEEQESLEQGGVSGMAGQGIGAFVLRCLRRRNA